MDPRPADGAARDAAEVAEMVAHARAVERLLTRLGWFVLVIGVVAVVVTLVQAVAGDISWGRALATILGTALAGILSGATAYGSGTNVGLSAERLVQSVGGPDRSR